MTVMSLPVEVDTLHGKVNVSMDDVSEQMVDILERFKEALLEQNTAIEKLKHACEKAIDRLEELNKNYGK